MKILVGLFGAVNPRHIDSERLPVDAEVRSTLAANLRKARTNAELTQKELAKLCNLSDRYIGLLERRAANVSVDVLAMLAKHLNTTPAALLTSHNDTH